MAAAAAACAMSYATTWFSSIPPSSATAARPVDDPVGQLDGVSGAGEVGCRGVVTGATLMAHLKGPCPARWGFGAAADDGDQRREDDGVVTRVDPGQRGQVGGHRDRVRPRPAPPPRRRRPRARRRARAPAGARRRRGGGRRASTGGLPPIRPADVIGSCATTQPPGRTAVAICARPRPDRARAAGGSGRTPGRPVRGGEVLAGLGEREHLTVGRRGPGGLVPGERIAVHRVDPPVPPDDLGQGDGDVATAGAHVDTSPSRPEPEAIQRRGQGAAVDVVAEPIIHSPGLRGAAPPWPGTLRVRLGTGAADGIGRRPIASTRERDHDAV